MKKTIESVEDFNKLTPEEKEKTLNEINEELKEAIKNDDSKKLVTLQQKKSWLPESIGKKVDNLTKIRNQNAITKEIEKFVRDNGRMPSVSEISLETGLSDTTIYNHLKELRTQNHWDNEMLMFNANRSRFLSVIAKEGLVDSKGAKMALDIIFAAQKQEPSSVNVTNAIQIIMSLPKEEQEKIKNAIVVSESNQTETK